jgi:mRNA-degrading endonuclease RelE of RelBE toxin-antitoxin system
VVQVWDLVDNVTLDGEKTGTSAAKFVARELKKQAKEIRVVPGDNIRTVTPHKIVGRDKAEIALRVREPIYKAEVRVGEYRKRYRVVSPTEVVKIILEQSDLEAFREAGEMTVSCHQREKEENDE